jgi:catechol 2,3-dioxygenase-like lactoylglutathione lyase family enzyme
MRPSILALSLAVPLLAQAPAPKADPFEAVRFLGGDWVGVSDGKAGSPSGAASFRFELEGKALVRRSHADYPAANGRPAAHHEDLMTVFAEGGQLKAFYVDNEGHVIRYLAAAVPQGVAFTSEPAPGPRFRLTYLRGTADTVAIRFEIAPSNAPDAFKTYLEGVTRRVK